MCPAKTAEEPIEMPFGGLTHVGQKKLLDGVEVAHRKGQLWVVRPNEKALGVSVAVYASKGTIQSLIMA